MERFKFPEDPKKDKREGFNIKVPQYEPDQEKFDALMESVRKSTTEGTTLSKPKIEKKEMGMLDAVRARLGLAPKGKFESSVPQPVLSDVQAPVEANPAQRGRAILTDEMIARSKQELKETQKGGTEAYAEGNLSRKRREIIPGGVSEESIKILNEESARKEKERLESLEKRTEFF